MAGLFFRVVNARYKDRQYAYLKLLESQRLGDKIKHKQLVNLSIASRLPPEKIKPLFDDLTKSIVFYKEIAELLPSSCRYLKTAYLLALENAFKVPQHVQDRDLREIIRTDSKIKHTDPDEDEFFNLFYKKARDYGILPQIIGWIENLENERQENSLLACFLTDSTGFPLMFKNLGRETGKEAAGLKDLKTKNLKPEFFLAPACERIYNTFRLMEPVEKGKSCVVQEIFVVKQLNGWSGKPEFSLKKLLVYGPASVVREEKIGRALLAVAGLKNHLDYVSSRIGMATRGHPVPAHELICTYFLSMFFKKMFDEITVRHNIQK